MTDMSRGLSEDVVVEARIAAASAGLCADVRVGGRMLPPPAHVGRYRAKHAAARALLEKQGPAVGPSAFVDVARLRERSSSVPDGRASIFEPVCSPIVMPGHIDSVGGSPDGHVVKGGRLTVIGIHGIGKQRLGRHPLIDAWSLGLADGLEFAAGGHVPRPSIDMVFYGDLFLDPAVHGMKGVAATEAWWAEASDVELAEFSDLAPEVFSAEELAQAEATSTKAYTRVPAIVRVFAAALDRRFGRPAVALLFGTFRQVRRYLLDPALKREVDARVASTLTTAANDEPSDPIVLLGHSLGSVVALEYVRQHPGQQLDLLVTMGSPVGLRMVRDRLPPIAMEPETDLPAGLRRWVNVRDPNDPVACAGDIGQWWPGVGDRPVGNGGDAHAAEQYLRKGATGQAVLLACPRLAG
jgi:hypothetical protein